MKFKIVQWNLCSFQEQSNHLKLLIAKYNPDVLALQETRFKSQEHSNISSFHCYFKNRTSAAGGVAVYIKSSLSVKQILINSPFEVVAVRVLCDTEITICNIYLPPNSNSFTVDKSDIEAIINQLPTPFILIGDVNAMNIIWGNSKNCNRGKIIENILDTHSNISLLNTGEPTHFCLFRGTYSAVDISLCSTSLLNTTSWEVLNHLYGSDHFPIILNYQYGHDPTNTNVMSQK